MQYNPDEFSRVMQELMDEHKELVDKTQTNEAADKAVDETTSKTAPDSYVTESQKQFNNIYTVADAYSALIKNVYMATMEAKESDLVGYILGDINNQNDLLLSMTTNFEALPVESLKDAVNLLTQMLLGKQDKNKLNQQADKKAEASGKLALSCLDVLYKHIKSATNNEPLIAGDLLLVLNYMACIAMPHIIMNYIRIENKDTHFATPDTANALCLPIDNMFNMLGDYEYNSSYKNVMPKCNHVSAESDTCDCVYCLHRRLADKYAANKP